MLLRSLEGDAIGKMAESGGTGIKAGNAIETGGTGIVTGMAPVAGGTVTVSTRPAAIGTASAK
jgi:hypothetical protein